MPSRLLALALVLAGASHSLASPPRPGQQSGLVLMEPTGAAQQGPRAGDGGAPPPWPPEARLFGSDQQPFWGFGSDAALDEDTAIVGAFHADINGNESQGAAYVFVRQGRDWVEQAQLLASDGAEQNWFGYSIALDGDVAVVGAPLADIDGQTFQGAVYVFERSGGVWSEVQKLTASDGDAQDRLGEAVAIEGDTIVATAIAADIGGNDAQGAAYAFHDQGGIWVEEAKLFDPEGTLADSFGTDVALRSETAVIGAHSAEIDGDPNRGAAYVFVPDGSTWILEAKLLASDGANPDQFGSAVAFHRNRALIGARQKWIDGDPAVGAAYVFRRDGSTWTEEQRLTALDGQPEGWFGKETAVMDGLGLIGADFDLPGDPHRGVVYEFRHQGAVWTEIQRFAAPIGNEFDDFGESIALTCDRVLIGNSGNDSLEPPGAAWVFRRPVLFQDGFESGDTGAWDQTVP